MHENVKEYSLYIHTSPDNRRYVGITSQEPKRRWSDGRGYKGNPYFYNAIKKYGWDSFDHHVYATGLCEEVAVLSEKLLIEFFRTFERENGFNMSLGGEVPANNMSNIDEYRLKQSLTSHMAYDPSKHIGKRRNAPPKMKESKYRKKVVQYNDSGDVIATYPSIHAAAKALNVHVMSVSESCNRGIRCKGYKLSFESDEFLSDGFKGSHCRIPVVQMNLAGDDMETFSSATDAARKFGRKNPCTILDACKGKQITAYGYKWRYK